MEGERGLQVSMESILGILVVLMTAVMAALGSLSAIIQPHTTQFQTHKTPQLIATATPIFSFLFICSPQINFHGNNASAKSIAAEYPAEKIL